MERRILQECPLCKTALKVRVLQCPSCHTKIEGTFDPPLSRLYSMSSRDIDFIELFVRLRGNIKEMEKALGVSYPTVRSMLDGVIDRLGFPERDASEKNRRLEIISQLESGKLTPEKAAELIKTGGRTPDEETGPSGGSESAE
ncbi:MAG: DUF2089 domain-containing protein [Spirochaetales bacterium]|nr:DUF2089 domain-containing protein [Spirochaetales bacterium]